MAFVTRATSTPATAMAFRDPLAAKSRVGFRRTMGGLGAVSSATDVTIGAGIGSVVPGLGTAIGGAVGAIVGLIGGGGTPDQMKAIWSVVPFSLIRLGGGHGTWTDPLSHETLTDAQSDVRKSAVVASAIGAFNDQKNWWYDNATQGHLNGAAALQRWQAKFGSLSFANAYAAYPGAFTIFSPITTTGDPIIRSPGVPTAIATPTTALGPLNTPIVAQPFVAQPILSTGPAWTSSNATPQQVASAPIVQQASLLGSLSGSTGLLLLAGLGVGLLLMNRGTPRSSTGE